MEESESGQVTVRYAVESDFPAISALIADNAKYLEKQSPILQSVNQLIEDCLNSTPPKFYCYVCITNNQIVGYSTYNHCYSTWVGRAMNIQDFYIRAEYRQAVQDQLMISLVKKASETGCKRVCWLAPNNATEYNAFWAKHGAMDETVEENWHQYRLESSAFQTFIDRCS